MNETLAGLRREYTLAGLRRSDLHPDPIVQFQAWFEAARSADVPEPSAMTLATIDPEGHPAARIVLLKGLDSRGFAFFTNYESHKARDLGANPHAALVFHWQALERQVRVTGQASKVSRAESSTYFNLRPRGARIGAWASHQSHPVPDRSALEVRYEEFERRFPTEEVPLPPYWGGYCVSPNSVEFWQGRVNRLHDRFRYARSGSGDWVIERLAP